MDGERMSYMQAVENVPPAASRARLMPAHTATRIAAVLLTLLLVVATQRDRPTFQILVFVAGFSHYFIALLFSKRPAVLAVSRTRGRVGVLALIFGAGAMYLCRVPLVEYFGIHHAFNEVYMLDRTVRPAAVRALYRLRAAAVALQGLAYLFVLRNQPHLDWASPTVLLLCLGLSAGAFGALLYRARSMFSRSELIDNVSGEVLALVLVAASFAVRVTFLEIVAYHFVFWFLYPIPKLTRGGRAHISRYVGLSAAVLLVAYCCSPLGMQGFRISRSLFVSQFTLWSYIHITISFALSNANPAVILRWFRP